ncbi:unnamed protein product [Gongylonema pulchrum]|uniref:SEA domain-containing protein n=1 Tax=Gongylonema pulchrum TaxID=637853 RepID=A0A183CZY6_9BILA|nr:unnamed protein product [Gongylonema pulchrum]
MVAVWKLEITHSDKEANVESAINLLNKTLEQNDITFTVLDGQRKTELKLSKASLGAIPSTWGPMPAPAPSFRGYTGGSMFVLGFFMLLLGAAIGVGVVYFVWKRQHLGSLAYQVFE